jgi:adenosine deaminase
MISHLHLHLEPEERKRRRLGLSTGSFRSREAFFHAHDLRRSDRPTVDARDLAEFLREVQQEQARQGVDYVELRVSPRRFLSHGLSWSSFLSVTHSALRASHHPTVRAVLVVNRDSPAGFMAQCQDRISAGLPWTFVGLDLAGDEERFPHPPGLGGLFAATRQVGLGVSVHAGEFGTVTDVWRAIDDLGATRLGHAVAAGASTALLKRLARDEIMVEVSITSNRMLGAVPPDAPHPVRRFAHQGVPICLNTDVPLHTGQRLADEYRLAERELAVGPEEVLTLQRRAHRHAFCQWSRREGRPGAAARAGGW